MRPRQLLFKKFPKLETENLVLRKLGHYDFENLNELLNNAEIQKYQTSNYYSREDIYNYVESQNETFHNHEIIKWAIERKADGKFLGLRILYCDDDSGWVEIQGDTKEEFWKKGYTKEAYLAIIEKLKNCGFKGVRSIIHADNINARFLLKSLRFLFIKEYLSNGITFHEYQFKIKPTIIDKVKTIFK